MLITDDIRKMAELNLCEKCYPIYQGLIEPNIRAMSDQFFHDWQEVEHIIFGMILKHAGAIKKPTEFFLEIDDKDLEAFSDHIDATIYRECKHKYGHFKDQLKYLHENGVIGSKLREYITLVAKRRHKVHGYKTSISDMERILFYLANQLLLHLKFGMCQPMFTDIHRKKGIEFTETLAEKYLKFLHIV